MTAAADVVVVGGGPAGAAAAVTARRRGASVTLVASGPARGARPGEGLPPGGDGVVAEVLGPGAFRPEYHRPSYGNRSAWGGERLDESDFMLHPLGHGWHLDRAAFDRGLLLAAREHGVRVLDGKRVRRATRRGDMWTLELDGAAVARGRVVVDATGRTAAIARAQGAWRRRVDRLVAVVWELAREGARDRDGTTLVEASAEGWWSGRSRHSSTSPARSSPSSRPTRRRSRRWRCASGRSSPSAAGQRGEGDKRAVSQPLSLSRNPGSTARCFQ